MSKNQHNFFAHKNEWSKVKDRILGGYLPQYIQKLLTSGYPIYYVDCFAGKGKYEDGENGSPIIALDIINDCVKKSRQYNSDEIIQTCFIELNHALDLEKTLEGCQNRKCSIDVVKGHFETTIKEKLRDKQRFNIFLYIDPYGIRTLDYGLFCELSQYRFHSFEMLINFNSFGFFRDACRAMKVDTSMDPAFCDLDDLIEYEPTPIDVTPQSRDLLSRIAGGDYWKAIVQDYKNGYINGYEAEIRFSTEYKQQLNKIFTYVLGMPIRLKPGQRPKYRLIHVCDHEDGCYLMADNMLHRKNELFLNVQQRGQLSIFDTNKSFSSTLENEIITEDDIIMRIRHQLAGITGPQRITSFLADFCNNNGVLCSFSTIHDILKDLENSGEILVQRTPELTEKTKKKTTFWTESRSKKVYIRRVDS